MTAFLLRRLIQAAGVVLVMSLLVSASTGLWIIGGACAAVLVLLLVARKRRPRAHGDAVRAETARREHRPSPDPGPAEAPAAAASAAEGEDTAAAAAASGVPAHLLERSKRRRTQLTGDGGDGGAAEPAAAAAATTGGGATATATAPASSAGPGAANRPMAWLRATAPSTRRSANVRFSRSPAATARAADGVNCARSNRVTRFSKTARPGSPPAATSIRRSLSKSRATSDRVPAGRASTGSARYFPASRSR